MGKAVSRASLAVRSPSRLGGRVGLSLFDQVISSATNFSITLIIVRYASPSELGEFTLAFAGYLIALNLARAISGIPLLLRDELKPGAGGAVSSAIVLGASITLVVGLPAVLLDAPSDILLIAIGMIFLLGQDAQRYVCFSHGKISTVILLDTVWLSATIPLSLLAVNLDESPVYGWVAGAALSLLIGLSWPLLRPAGWAALMAYIRSSRRLILSLSAESLCTTSIIQLVPYVLSLFVGLIALGQYRGAYTIVAPATLLFTGIAPVLIGEFARSWRISRSRLLIVSAGSTTTIAVIGLGYVGVVGLIPASLLARIFGANVEQYTPLTPVIGLLVVASIVYGNAMNSCRPMVDPARILALRTVLAVLELGSIALGAGLRDLVTAIVLATLVNILGLFSCLYILLAPPEILTRSRSKNAESRWNQK